MITVKIDANGTLEMTPETGIENYALKMWWDEYTKEQGGGLRVNLMVEDKSRPEIASEQ